LLFANQSNSATNTGTSERAKSFLDQKRNTSSRHLAASCQFEQLLCDIEASERSVGLICFRFGPVFAPLLNNVCPRLYLIPPPGYASATAHIRLVSSHCAALMSPTTPLICF
jgi:hypothetical protein